MFARRRRWYGCFSGVATGWTGVDMSTPLFLEVAPEIDTNPTSFYMGVGGSALPPDPRYRLALAMYVHILTWPRPARAVM